MLNVYFKRTKTNFIIKLFANNISKSNIFTKKKTSIKKVIDFSKKKKKKNGRRRSNRKYDFG